MHRVLERQLRKLRIGAGEPPDAEQWQRLLERVDRAYTEADQDRYTLERALDLSSAEMRTRFADLRRVQHELVETSRKLGRADVATSVLHNVGNVLNSVNVSANLLGELVRSSARRGLGKCLQLLERQSDPVEFLRSHARGQQVLPYLGAVDTALQEEGTEMLREVESLAKSVDHMKRVIEQQLAAARGELDAARVVERVLVDRLVEDSLAVLERSLAAAPRVQIVRELESFGIVTDGHKVIQIVTNLLANARDALVEGGTIVVRTRRMADGVAHFEVQDDGVGIDSDLLASIFQNGFTTKAHGHGVGLHASACAAMELGGRLRAASAGPGAGSCFTLELPDLRHRLSGGPVPAGEPT